MWSIDILKTTVEVKSIQSAFQSYQKNKKGALIKKIVINNLCLNEPATQKRVKKKTENNIRWWKSKTR